MGSAITSALGKTVFTALLIASVASHAVSEPLNESGETRMVIVFSIQLSAFS